MRSLFLAICIGAAAMFVAACGTESSANTGAPSGYQPVPDQQLFTAIKRLPQVTESHVTYVNQLGTSNSYRGYVTLRPGLSEAKVTEAFDHVLVILRHGRWRADVGNIQAQSADIAVGSVSLDLGPGSSYRQTYEDRYGPQTGQKDWPPSFVPN